MATEALYPSFINQSGFFFEELNFYYTSPLISSHNFTRTVYLKRKPLRGGIPAWISWIGTAVFKPSSREIWGHFTSENCSFNSVLTPELLLQLPASYCWRDSEHYHLNTIQYNNFSNFCLVLCLWGCKLLPNSWGYIFVNLKKKLIA